MRFHVVGLPFEPQPQCAYSGKHERFVRMMRARGHEAFDYSATPDEWDPQRRFEPTNEHWTRMNGRVIAEIAGNNTPEDFLCLIAGRCQELVATALPHLRAVEYGVGYGGVLNGFRIFESYAWMHTVYGAKEPALTGATTGRFYDAVIPNYFDVDDFPAGQGDGGYYAFVGRLTSHKGFQIAADVCERIGAPLTIAGEGDPPGYGDYVGVVGPDERAKIMGGATAVFVPTYYVEPFGGVACEAMLCGTPVITTDFGAFTETVEQGVTGWRCRTMGEFQWAARHAHELDRQVIREKAIARWSLDAVAPQYEAHFARLAGLRDGHDFAESDDREILVPTMGS